MSLRKSVQVAVAATALAISGIALTACQSDANHDNANRDNIDHSDSSQAPNSPSPNAPSHSQAEQNGNGDQSTNTGIQRSDTSNGNVRSNGDTGTPNQ